MKVRLMHAANSFSQEMDVSPHLVENWKRFIRSGHRYSHVIRPSDDCCEMCGRTDHEINAAARGLRPYALHCDAGGIAPWVWPTGASMGATGSNTHNANQQQNTANSSIQGTRYTHVILDDLNPVTEPEPEPTESIDWEAHRRFMKGL